MFILFILFVVKQLNNKIKFFYITINYYIYTWKANLSNLLAI